MKQTVKISEFVNFEPKELFDILTQQQVWSLLFHIKEHHVSEMFEAMGENMVLEWAADIYSQQVSLNIDKDKEERENQ